MNDDDQRRLDDALAETELADMPKASATYAKEVLAGHMAWMMAHVRCETCKWWWCDKGTTTQFCGRNEDAPYGGKTRRAADSCATHWEPKP